MFVNSDFTDLLKTFNDNNVKYMVIGGYAVIQYGECSQASSTVVLQGQSVEEKVHSKVEW